MSALAYITRANLKVRLGIDESDTKDDDLLDDVVGEVNAYMEHVMRRPVGPINGGTAVTYTFDAAEDVYPDGSLFVRHGVQSISSGTVAASTGEAGIALDTDDLVILPRSQNRRPDWPGFWVRFKDEVTGSVSDWGTGYGNIILVLVAGWAAFPPEIQQVGYVTAARAWSARASGQTDIVGTDENGTPLISRFLSSRDRGTLEAFRPDRLAVG